MKERPFFMKNKEWYYFDNNDQTRGIKLTDKAPPKAIKSYEEFYKADIYIDENGVEWISD